MQFCTFNIDNCRYLKFLLDLSDVFIDGGSPVSIFIKEEVRLFCLNSRKIGVPLSFLK